MDLVDEYLRIVAALLPKAQREDIVAELRDIILSRIEAREADLGRKLTPDETETLLREIGHPLVVTARYREGPQHVVGPTLYPYWLFVVKIAITIQVAVAAVVLVVRTFGGEDFGHALGQAIGSGVSGAITLVGLATVAAWLIERYKVRIAYLDQWRVRDLHMLEFAAWDWSALRGFADRDSGRFEGPRPPRVPVPPRPPLPPKLSPLGRALGATAAGSVLVLWWIGALDFGLNGTVSDLRELGLEPGALEGVDWAGIRQTLLWPVLALGLGIVFKGVLMLAYPRAAWLRGLMEIAVGGAMLALCAWFWNVSPLAAAVRVDSVPAFVQMVRTEFEHTPPVPLAPVLTIILVGVSIGAVAKMLRGLWEMVTPAPQPSRHAFG